MSLLIATLFIGLWASVAFAECAWVLWRSDTEVTVLGKLRAQSFIPNETRPSASRYWEIETATANLAECTSVRQIRSREHLERAKRPGRTMRCL